MQLQERLKVKFRDETLLQQALRHRSVTLDSPLESNERLEFLGDAVLGMVVCEYLVARFPQLPEGHLAKAKAFLVSEPTLAEAARSLGIDAAVQISSAEELAGGRARRSILADTFEAVIAAVYLDQGIRTARRVIHNALRPALEKVARDEHYQDYKSLLQERFQGRERVTPYYRIALETGADHDKTFVAQVWVGERVLGEGTGKSKKQAEQAAARAAWEKTQEE